jgi:uncharacterized membrane protein
MEAVLVRACGCARIAWRAITASDRSTDGKDRVAKSHSRLRNWATVAAFTLIIALTVAEGVDEGFSVWDWLIIAVGAVFIVQALFRLNARRSART